MNVHANILTHDHKLLVPHHAPYQTDTLGLCTKISLLQDKLINALEGGTPQRFTVHSVNRLLAVVTAKMIPYGDFRFIDIGHGDARVLACAHAHGARHVSGVEMCTYEYHYSPQAHAKAMFGAVNRLDSLQNCHWGVNIRSITGLDSITKGCQLPVAVYSFDFGMGLETRLHWLTMCGQDARVKLLITCAQDSQHIDTLMRTLNFIMSSHVSCTISGSRTHRKMLIYQRMNSRGLRKRDEASDTSHKKARVKG